MKRKNTSDHEDEESAQFSQSGDEIPKSKKAKAPKPTKVRYAKDLRTPRKHKAILTGEESCSC